MTTYLRQGISSQEGLIQALYDHDAMIIHDDVEIHYEAPHVPLTSDQDIVINGSLLRHSDGGGGALDTFVRNGGFTDTGSISTSYTANLNWLNTKISNVKIRGRGYVGATSQEMDGGVFCINGDDWEVEGVTIPSWSEARAVVVAGDRWDIRGVNVYGGDEATNNGGIRVVGGYDWKVSHCNVDCGDDVYQVVPIAYSPTVPMSGLSVGRGTFEYSTGRSSHARLMAVVLMKNNQNDLVDPISMANSIEDITFRDIRGEGGAYAMSFMNYNSSGAVDGINIVGGFTDMLKSTRPLPGSEVYVRNNAGTKTDGTPFAAGGIRNIRSTGHKVLNPRVETMTRFVTVDAADLATMELETLAEVA